MRIMIDTNVLIDYLLSRHPYEASATKIMMLCKNSKIEGCIAAHSFLNIFYVLRKELTNEQRRKVLKGFCAFLEVIGVDKLKIISSLNNCDFSDFEDCVQSECAKEFAADYIITRNIKDFKTSEIPAITPDDFLERVVK